MQQSGPLRVAYVLSHFHPNASGAERQALAQGTELTGRGHEVRVITRHVPGLPRNETIDGVQVHRWVRTSTAGPLFGLSFLAGVGRALLRLRGRIDLVHTHQGLWEAIATGLARPILGRVPSLVQPASSGYFGEAEELLRTKGAGVLRRLILRNTAFAAISADIERQWLDLGVRPNRLFRTVSGVDADRFRPGPSGLEDRLGPRPRMIFTGRLHPQKGLDRLLEAWPEVHRRVGGSLILLGDGPDRARLETASEAFGVGDSVVFPGRVADPADYLRAADLFVLPSVAEGMSNSLLEAMASGLPCVVSDIGGNRDLIEPGRTGWLVAPEDHSGWVEALCQGLSDRELAGRMGREARDRVDREFALGRVVDRYLDLYRKLLAEAGRRPSGR